MADQWTKHLADKGYTGIALPSPEFRLLTLVFEHRGARGHQNAFDQLAPGVAATLPPPEQNANLPSIAGERTRSVDLSVGLNALSGLIGALGGGTLGLEAGFRAARNLSFAYDGITSERLNAVALQIALNGVAAPAPGLLRDWLDDHLYMITGVLRATKISVTGRSETGATAKVDMPAITNAVGGGVSVKIAAADQSTVTFEGAAAVPFAAKLFRVVSTRTSSGERLTLKAAKEGSVKVVGLAMEDAATEEERAADLAPAVLDWAPERESEEE